MNFHVFAVRAMTMSALTLLGSIAFAAPLTVRVNDASGQPLADAAVYAEPVSGDPMPYWGYPDLEYTLGTKLKNAFYVEAQVKRIDGVEHFWFRQAKMLAGISFAKFPAIAELGKVKVDFDARTGHNHETKFRVTADALPDLYDTNILLFSHEKET